MKNLVLITLFIALLGCKLTDSSKSSTITPQEMWMDFVSSNPQYNTIGIPSSWHFHNNAEDADRLAHMVLTHQKRAVSSLYLESEQVPVAGTFYIITDYYGWAKAIIQVNKVSIVSFGEISEEYAAIDMGTNVNAWDKWKKAHWPFFTKRCASLDIPPSQNMSVICEYFKLVSAS